jgi:cytochrome c oxidase subunit 4
MATSDTNGTSNQQVHTLPLVKAGPLHGPELAAAHHPTPEATAHRDHVPHVLPFNVYLGTWIVLVIATAITVGASYVNFGSWNILIALGIATVKATVVGLMFMHLRWDHKFHSIVFGFSLIFLAIFIAFTMYDTETRGRTDPKEGDRPAVVTTPFKEGKQSLKLKAKYEKDVPPPTEPPR